MDKMRKMLIQTKHAMLTIENCQVFALFVIDEAMGTAHPLQSINFLGGAQLRTRRTSGFK